MPLLYHHVTLYPEGMISAEPFTLPGDGRKLFFDIYPGGSFRKEIFIAIDGKLADAAFANGSRLETPIRGLQRLLRTPHDAVALVVDRTETPISTIDLPISPIPVTFADGQRSVIKLAGTLTATIYPRDPARLAGDYASGAVSSPEAAAAAALKAAALRAAVSHLPAALGEVTPHEAIGRVDRLALEIGEIAAEAASRALPWCQVATCDVLFEILNVDELTQRTNAVYEMNRETQRSLLNAILSTFGNSPLPAEVSQIMLSYIQANPGLPGAEIKAFCTELHNIWQRTTPLQLVTAARQLGMLPAAKGGP